jgi:NAD/NADP transhydrogenase beta subunit
MTPDIRRSALSVAVGDVLQDVSELQQKEFQFARGEFSAKLDAVVRRVAWIAAAGVFAVIALLALVQAAVFALADAGLALHWSCLIVGGALAGLALLTYIVGRTGNHGALSPSTTLHHLTMDIRTAKEHLR